MAGTVAHPFGVERVETIPLNPPPLVRVLTQVRFPHVFAVAEEAFAGRFQQALGADYPIASSDFEFVISLSPAADAPPSGAQTRLWRFAGIDGSWRVSLGTGFVTLETTDYRGHVDFFGRLERVLGATAEHANPALVERVGVRYIQQLTEPTDLDRLSELVRAEVLGVYGVPVSDAQLEASLCQSRYRQGDVLLAARWGLLPQNAAVDAALPAASSASWVLDVDVFEETRRPFDVEGIVARALDFSRRQYRFFRWAVEPEFLLRFGADPALVEAAKEAMKA